MSLNFNPLLKTVTLPGPERSKRTVVFLRNAQATEPKVLFAGESQGFLGSAKAKALTLGAMLTALAAPLGMAKAQEAPVAQPPQTNGQAVQLPNVTVNNAADLQGHLKKDMQSPIAVLANNSLLSKEAQKELHDLLVAFDKEGKGQLAVVEIADTNRADMNDLATQIFNQMQLGQQGKNNGVLLLLNNKGIHESTRGKQMTIKPGAGLKGTFTAEASTQLLIKHAVPHLKQKDYDGAVKETVNAIKQMMTQAANGGVPANNFVGNHNNNRAPVNQAPKADEPMIDAQTALIIALVAIVLLLIIIAAAKGGCDGVGGGGGYSGGGYSGGGYSGGGYSGGSSSSSSSGGSWGGSWGSSSSGGSDSGGYSGGGGGFSDGGGGSI